MAIGIVSMLVVFQLVTGLPSVGDTKGLTPTTIALVTRSLVAVCKDAIRTSHCMSDLVDTAVYLVDSAAPVERYVTVD